MTTLWTVGHSNLPQTDFIDRLRAADIGVLVDVRTRPASRRHPWVGRRRLTEALAQAGIRYEWEGEALGGLRRASPQALRAHPALGEGGYSAYAAHMQSPAFAEAVARLLDKARAAKLTVMCAEAEPARCHRSLLSDYLSLIERVQVRHLLLPVGERRHRPHTAARESGGALYYDAAGQLSLGLS